MDIDQAPASDDVPGSSVESPPEAKYYQTVAFRKAMPDDAQYDPPRFGFASAEEAAARCEALGFDCSDLEEHSDSFLFHQKGITCKDAGEGEITDLADGIKAIGCPTKAVAIGGALGDAGDEHGYDEVPPTKTVRQVPVTKISSSGLSGGGERAAIAGGNADTLARVPAGAQFVKDYCGHHRRALDLHDEHAGMLEHPAVAAIHDAWAQEDLARDDEINGILAELYPDVSFPDMPPAAPGVSGEVPVDPLVKGPGPMDEPGPEVPGIEGGAVGAALTPDEDDMPFGASYLRKVKEHCDRGQEMLAAGVKKQEHPKVIDFADDELTRLGKRVAGVKKVMSKNYKEHVGKVFGEDEGEPETVASPDDAGDDAALDAAIVDSDIPEGAVPPLDDADADLEADIDVDIEAGPPDDDEEDDDEPEEEPEDEPAKKGKKAAPAPAKAATTTDLLRAVVKGLDDLTKSVAAKTAPKKPAPAPKTAPKAAPASPSKPATSKPAPKPAAKPAKPAVAKAAAANPVAVAEAEPVSVPDPETVQRLDALRKQIANLVEREKRFQMRLASKVGANGKKKSCDCGGSCGPCQVKGYFTDKDAGTLSAIDESAGAALVPQPATETKEALEDCVSRKISIFAKEHPDWSNDQCVAAAHGYCGADKTDKPKKRYHIAATLKGRTVAVLPGRKIPFFAEDWRIEDEAGTLFDNRIFPDFKSAEKMLLELV